MNRFSLLILLILLSLASAQVSDPQEILRIIDERANFTSDLAATITLTSRDPAQGDEVQEAQIFRRDGDELFLILFRRPETQLGQGYLMLEDGLWFYDPESRQFTYTSSSESFGGTDARNSDFEASSLAQNYRVVSQAEDTLGRFDVWVLELEATRTDVTHPFVKIWVSKDDALVLKTEDYSLSRRLLRSSYFPSYTRAGEGYIATRMIFVDELVEGKSTTIDLSNISSAPIPDNVFSKAYVERVNR